MTGDPQEMVASSALPESVLAAEGGGELAEYGASPQLGEVASVDSAGPGAAVDGDGVIVVRTATGRAGMARLPGRPNGYGPAARRSKSYTKLTAPNTVPRLP